MRVASTLVTKLSFVELGPCSAFPMVWVPRLPVPVAFSLSLEVRWLTIVSTIKPLSVHDIHMNFRERLRTNRALRAILNEELIMLFCLKEDMNKVWIDLIVTSYVLLLEKPFRWEHSRQNLFYFFRISRLLPTKAQFGTYFMNLMIVLSDGLEVLNAEMGPIMECFKQDNCLLLYIPRFEGLEQMKWGFLLQILRLHIYVDMVPYNVQGNIFLLISKWYNSSRNGILRGSGLHALSHGTQERSWRPLSK